MQHIKQDRIRVLKSAAIKNGPIVYWMSRDQRVHDNWAFLYAQELAASRNTHVEVVFCLSPQFLNATQRHYDFMLKGLRDVEQVLRDFNVPFTLIFGSPSEKLPDYIAAQGAGAVVVDFSPLRISQNWKRDVCAKSDVAVFEVDAHNIVPAWVASTKQEFSARTFRLKMNRIWQSYVEEFPKVLKQSVRLSKPVQWESAQNFVKPHSKVMPVTWVTPGAHAAEETLKNFISYKLTNYDTERNLPYIQGQSDLSPYLHFGHISAARVVLEVQKHFALSSREAASFIEELVVRRELSDNFCFYNAMYDSVDGFPDWAKKTLNKHVRDKRPVLYSYSELETARTHDDLWNAAQQEMVVRGKMHGYLRMYWAKKILEWSVSPEEALCSALSLNDTYELDGRDPNGYVGIAWSIGGVHDRPWFDRPIYGTVRYMSRESTGKKCKADQYIKYVNSLV